MIHHVFACKSNIGDWLSAQGIQSLLAPMPITEHLCDEPFIAATLDRLSAVDEHDLILVGGGGLFMDYFSPFWEGLAPIARRVPVCLWGVGYCDLKSAPSRTATSVLQNIVRDSRMIIVRDRLTREQFADQELPEPIACPATVMLEPPESPGIGLLHVVHYDVVGHAVYELMDAVASAFADRTARPYRYTDNQIDAGDAQQLAGLIRRYAEADLVLTSRLHGCIIGLAMGRKVLAVSGDQKIEAFMDSVGLAAWVLEPKRIDRLPELLETLPSQASVQDDLQQVRRANTAVATQIRQLAEQLQVMCQCRVIRPVGQGRH